MDAILIAKKDDFCQELNRINVFQQKNNQSDALYAHNVHPASKSGHIPDTSESCRNISLSMVLGDVQFSVFRFPLILRCSACSVSVALSKDTNRIFSKLL